VNHNKKNGLPISAYFGYGAGQVGGQILRDTPALILPIYMSTVLGLDPAIGALVILIAKIWVVIADPIAGIISDKTNTRWGRRRPFILAGGLIASLSFVMLFFVPEIKDQAIFIYMTGVYLLLNTGYSMFSVPYLTMASEMSDDADERTTILSFRNGALAIGLLIGGALAPEIISRAIQDHGQSAQQAYEWMALVVGSVIMISTLCVFFGTRSARGTAADEVTLPLITQIKTAWTNKPFVTLITANIVQYISAGIGYAGGIFFFAYTMGFGAQSFSIIAIWIIVISLASIGSMPILVWASKLWGKMSVYKWCLLLYAICIQFYWIADKDSMWIVWCIALGIGLFNGGFILMSFSVLTDTINFDRMKSGVSREGALSSVYSAVDKVGNALGSAAFLAYLSFIGFVESSDGSMAPQSDYINASIAFAYILIPAFLHAGSILILNYYKLEGDKQ
jgi:glycoside/pentoside/hexuronide:cation symporter, GPH family